MGIKEKLQKELQLSKDYVALATVSARAYQETNMEIIEYLVNEQNTPGVYVTLNKPFDVVKAALDAKQVNTDMILFIDAVTKTAGGNAERTDKCLFIGNPENLSDISMSMDQAVRAIPEGEKFLFFDSLNTLLLYNHAATVAKFVHFLSTKMRVWKVKGIIISLEKESNKELIDELSQFCDIHIEV